MSSSVTKNVTMACLALAFTAHIVSWMALGRDSLEVQVADNLSRELRRSLLTAQANGGYCMPRHVVIETKTPSVDTLSAETIATLTSQCEALGVTFHPEPPKEDLGCMPDGCGDCVGYAQQIRLNTPFVAAADAHYFRRDVYQSTEHYYYVWWINHWVQFHGPRFRED